MLSLAGLENPLPWCTILNRIKLKTDLPAEACFEITGAKIELQIALHICNVSRSSRLSGVGIPAGSVLFFEAAEVFKSIRYS
jgi:hypothetical protein